MLYVLHSLHFSRACFPIVTLRVWPFTTPKICAHPHSHTKEYNKIQYKRHSTLLTHIHLCLYNPLVISPFSERTFCARTHSLVVILKIHSCRALFFSYGRVGSGGKQKCIPVEWQQLKCTTGFRSYQAKMLSDTINGHYLRISQPLVYFSSRIDTFRFIARWTKANCTKRIHRYNGMRMAKDEEKLWESSVPESRRMNRHTDMNDRINEKLINHHFSNQHLLIVSSLYLSLCEELTRGVYGCVLTFHSTIRTWFQIGFELMHAKC